MASPALLEFLALAVRAHSARGVSDTTRVVRLVLADPEIDSEEGDGLVDLLAGVASYSQAARAIHADSAETEFGTGITDPDLRGALTAVTDQIANRPGPLLDVGIDERGVRIADKSPDVLSKGEREFLGVIAALLDPAWQGMKLGILTYSEESMDPWLKRAAWDSISVALDGKRIADVETLIIITRSGNVDIAMHCADRFGADWVIESDRLVRRGPAESARQHASEIARASLQPTVLYLGAGFLFSSGLPSGNNLRDHALRAYFTADPDAAVEPLARRLFQNALEANKLTADQNDSEDKFIETFTLEDVIALVTELTKQPPSTLDVFAERHAHAKPGAAMRNLVKTVGQLAGLVIVTVNFDELIEQECGDGVVFPVVTEDEFKEFPTYLTSYLAGDQASVPVVKLHGTISARESCVLSALETRVGLAAPKAEALRALTRSVAEHNRANWVYIGTSMRDRDIVPVLREPEFAAAFEESWVMPLRPAGVDQLGDHRGFQWTDGQPNLDKRTFSVSADTFMGFMAEADTGA
jgi:SIR2-like protein